MLEQLTPGETLDQLVFEHRLLPLLRGEVVVDRVVLEGAQIEVISYEVEEPESGEAQAEVGEPESPAAAAQTIARPAGRSRLDERRARQNSQTSGSGRSALALKSTRARGK